MIGIVWRIMSLGKKVFCYRKEIFLSFLVLLDDLYWRIYFYLGFFLKEFIR